MRLFTDDAAGRLDNIEGLYKHLTNPPSTAPSMPTIGEYLAMARVERDAFNRRRLDHLSSDFTIATHDLKDVSSQMRLTALRNRTRTIGRGGVMLSGYSAMGKTTAALTAMREVFAQYIAENPNWSEQNRLPVVYVEVPPTSSGKAMMGRFLEFLGVDGIKNWTLEQRTQAVVQILNKAGTRFVVVDEFHNLVAKSAGSQETANVLKGLSNSVPATFVYSGINIHRSDVLAGATGQQIASRFSPVLLESYSMATADDKKRWRGLIRAFEREMCLFNHPEGTLNSLSAYLYNRTQGAIGSLSRLLVSSAQLIILEGSGTETETITEERLASIPLDLRAQNAEREQPSVAPSAPRRKVKANAA
ncbi:TniB family NTP-binding protein [Mycetocola sp.]|uniref:TniB family NTP-binding protein n=1 Tax=Mycetocola sp. TaxID=1871042 RepID=UPI003988D753